MEITRYIIVKAVKTKNENELIPIWDDRLTYDKQEDESDCIKVDGEWQGYYYLVDVVFDLKTKKICTGIELDHYPKEKDIDHKIGDYVMHELKGRVLSRRKVVDIVYEQYDLTIGKGGKLDRWWNELFPMEKELIYAIKSWKPFYILDNGIKVEWSHELYKIQEDEKV